MAEFRSDRYKRPVNRSEGQDFDRFVQLAAAGAVAFSLWRPLIILYSLVVYSAGASHPVPAAVATACYLPVVFWLMRAAVRGNRSRVAGWVVAALAAGFLATLPVFGIGSLGLLQPLAALALITIPWPWSLPAFAAVAAAPIPVSLALGQGGFAAVTTLDTAYSGALIAATVWLVGAVRHLRAARLELAEAAVLTERLRIDNELRQTLDAALATIAAAGERAGEYAAWRPAGAEAELRDVARASRAALVESRRLVLRYRQVSLRAELEAAASLLSATGIRTRIALPADGLPESLSTELRSQLRNEVSRRLREDTQDPCVVAVRRRDGRLQLEVHRDGQPPRGATEVSR